MDFTAPGASSLTIVVEPAPHPLGHRFAVHAVTETGWMGAVELAGQERLWLFSDTMLAGGQWVNNCIVVEDVARGELRTVLGGRPSGPDDWVTPLNKVGPDGLSRWLWAGHGVAVDDPDLPADQHRAWVYFQEYRATVPDNVKGEWDFAITDAKSAPAETVAGRSPAPQ